MTSDEYAKAIIKRRSTFIGVIVGIIVGLYMLWLLVGYLYDNDVNEYITDLLLSGVLLCGILSGGLVEHLIRKRWVGKLK